MDAPIGKVINEFSRLMQSEDAELLVRQAVEEAVGEMSNLTRGKCRLASRVARRVPLLGLPVEIDELVDHCLAHQRNQRIRGGPSVFGYTHRTMDPVYGDPCYDRVAVHNAANEPVAAFVSASRPDRSGVVECLVVTPYPDDEKVKQAIQQWVGTIATLDNRRAEIHLQITHEAAFFAKFQHTPPGCSYGPCDECAHPRSRLVWRP